MVREQFIQYALLLNNQNAIKILDVLIDAYHEEESNGELTATDIFALSGLLQGTASRLCKILLELDLVTVRDELPKRYYCLNFPKWIRLKKSIFNFIKIVDPEVVKDMSASDYKLFGHVQYY